MDLINKGFTDDEDLLDMEFVVESELLKNISIQGEDVEVITKENR